MFTWIGVGYIYTHPQPLNVTDLTACFHAIFISTPSPSRLQELFKSPCCQNVSARWHVVFTRISICGSQGQIWPQIWRSVYCYRALLLCYQDYQAHVWHQISCSDLIGSDANHANQTQNSSWIPDGTNTYIWFSNGLMATVNRVRALIYMIYANLL